jgi:hypothetical protein
MGQSSVSDEAAETLEAPINSMAVDKMILKKAARNSTVRIKQVIAFFFISFYLLDILAETDLGRSTTSGEATATRHSLSINI